ncbi:MAG: CHRD domain-containing protein [Chloroflexi bacterium]|nr:MAG: CHRD domain-containing protein [Chloroflexota bacterium]
MDTSLPHGSCRAGSHGDGYKCGRVDADAARQTVRLQGGHPQADRRDRHVPRYGDRLNAVLQADLLRPVQSGDLWLCGSAGAPGPAGTPTCPAGGGTVSRSGVTASDIRPVPDQNVAAGDFPGALRIIESGDAYVNVHTVNFPGGEIRGEVKSED